MELSIRNDQPGPGNYDPSQSQVKDKTVVHKFGDDKGKRTDIVTKEEYAKPGPG